MAEEKYELGEKKLENDWERYLEAYWKAKDESRFGGQRKSGNLVQQSQTQAESAKPCFPEDLVARYREIINEMRYLEAITNGKVKESAAKAYIIAFLFAIGLFFGINLFGMLIAYLGGVEAGVAYVFVLIFVVAPILVALGSNNSDNDLPQYRARYKELEKQRRELAFWFLNNCKDLPRVS